MARRGSSKGLDPWSSGPRQDRDLLRTTEPESTPESGFRGTVRTVIKGILFGGRRKDNPWAQGSPPSVLLLNPGPPNDKTPDSTDDPGHAFRGHEGGLPRTPETRLPSCSGRARGTPFFLAQSLRQVPPGSGSTPSPTPVSSSDHPWTGTSTQPPHPSGVPDGLVGHPSSVKDPGRRRHVSPGHPSVTGLTQCVRSRRVGTDDDVSGTRGSYFCGPSSFFTGDTVVTDTARWGRTPV